MGIGQRDLEKIQRNFPFLNLLGRGKSKKLKPMAKETLDRRIIDA